DGHVHADVRVHPELDALASHLLEALIEDLLLHLEFRDAVTQQAADAVVTLEYAHLMAGASQLLGCRQTGRAGTDHGDFLAGFDYGRERLHFAVLPCVLGDRELDGPDRYRIIVDAKHARTFARRRTKGAGELRKIIGLVQAIDRVLPAAAIDEVVPIGNHVTKRAALMAKRNAAIHAARALLLQLVFRIRPHDLLPVTHTLRDRPIRLLGAFELDEAFDITHAPRPSPPGLQARRFHAPGGWPRALACNPSE